MNNVNKDLPDHIKQHYQWNRKLTNEEKEQIINLGKPITFKEIKNYDSKKYNNI